MKSLQSKITIRVTEQEKIQLVESAKEWEITLSTYLRLRLLATSQKEITIIETDWQTHNLLGEIKYQLRKIGTNINQLARNSNLNMQMGTSINLEHQKLIEMSEVITNTFKAITEIQSKIRNDR